MLFIYEIKKIMKRITPLFVLIFILAVATGTIMITAITCRRPEPVDHTADYLALRTKMANWNEGNQSVMETAFQTFYARYQEMNASTYDGTDLAANYQSARQAFQHFYSCYNDLVFNNDINATVADYMLVHHEHIDTLQHILQNLDIFFTGNKTESQIIMALTVNNWDYATIEKVFNNIFVQQIPTTELTALNNFLQQHEPSNDAYFYARNRFLLAIAQNSDYLDPLSTYEGFSDYINNEACQRQLTLATYRLQNVNTPLAQAFTFGNIYNNTDQVSLTDFAFNNLEMACVPILVLTIIFAAATFFTDTYRKTIITSLSIARHRSTVIIAKTVAVMILTLACMLIFTGIYFLIGTLFFNAQITPDILCLFNDRTPLVIAPLNYFLLYFFSLFGKTLPFIAICGLYSFAKFDPRAIVGSTVGTAIIIILANALLGSLRIYQYCPLLGLDFIRYFGAKLCLSPNPPTFNFWYNVPLMTAINIYLFGQLLHNFRKRDF